MNRLSLTLACAIGALFAGSVEAQTYRDLTMVRGRPSPWSSVLQFRAGALGSIASDEVPSIGLEDKIGVDGHAYFHQDNFGDRQAVLDVYAGRDGAYLGVTEGRLLGGETQSRLEVTARYFPFYREGYYQDHDFIPTGRYEGRDYGVGLYLAREVSEGARFEIGPFYRRMTFDRNAATADNYTIPDDYNAYGARASLEHTTLVLDRMTGRRDAGYIFTIAVEREQNDSDRLFGVGGIFESALPTGLWRGFGHVEWYLPQSDTLTWALNVDGQFSDSEDRVNIYDAQKPIGHLWGDGELGLRLELGQAFWVMPLGKLQFVRALDQDGVGSRDELFFGGGVDMQLDFAAEFSLVAEYSYLNNESREPVSVSNDTFGQHRFFAGFEARFGASRR